ncbi:MAG: TIGR01212 family radical SAM protein [Lachnospiraceae bacterium]|jgi:radical SAM protein (TIGR01212 family)|nr:TIGR01212 family radical SAM protein [Lachnospiraceae bacterium]
MDFTRSICRYPDGRPYYSLGLYMRRQFGRRVYKLALDGGMTCPNRDGTVGYGGCVFCSAGGSGEYAADAKLSVAQQLRQAKGLLRREATGYIAYFQAYTNTYGPVEYLEQIFSQAMEPREIVALSVATRPDCLGEPVTALLDRLSLQKPVWVELGLQTMHEETARKIRRGYELPCFEQAVRRLRAGGHAVIVHVILGLPGEDLAMMTETVRYLGQLGIDGIKLQLLHVLKGTELAGWYRQGNLSVMEKEAYFEAVSRCLEVLPGDVAVHRLTGDGPKDMLVAPLWSRDKKRVLNELHHYLKVNGVMQGRAV